MSNATPLDGIDVILADLDGVIYRGAQAVPHAVAALKKAAQKARLGFVTNNASRTPAQVAEQIAAYGLPALPEAVVTPASSYQSARARGSSRGESPGRWRARPHLRG